MEFNFYFFGAEFATYVKNQSDSYVGWSRYLSIQNVVYPDPDKHQNFTDAQHWVFSRGFNVSNLMGIKRRMIDIGKIFCKKYQYGYKKNAEFYADFKFVDADKCP